MKNNDFQRNRFIKQIRQRITKLKLYKRGIKVFYDNQDNILNFEQDLKLYDIFGIQDIIKDKIIINELLDIFKDIRNNSNILFDSKIYNDNNYIKLLDGYYQIEL